MVLGQVAITEIPKQNDSVEIISDMEVDTAIKCTNVIDEHENETIENQQTVDTTSSDAPENPTVKSFNQDLIDDKKWIRIYPNPTVTNATIEWKDESENIVEVFDMSGKSVWKIRVKGSRTVFNTANLQNGEYVVKITSVLTQKSETAKLIIAK